MAARRYAGTLTARIPSPAAAAEGESAAPAKSRAPRNKAVGGDGAPVRVARPRKPAKVVRCADDDDEDDGLDWPMPGGTSSEASAASVASASEELAFSVSLPATSSSVAAAADDEYD